jgi:AcrR family transcriptional regulator
MSRFSDAERERIRTQLIEAGRDLFAQFGFERTRIKDITDAVEIGTSTFYQFFDSKEALYVEVLCVERDELEAQIDAAVSAVATPREEVRTMLETMFREIHANPLISRLIVDNELYALHDQLSAADQEELAARIQQSELSYADQWVDVAAFRIEDPAVVRGLIRSLVFTTRSRDTLVEAGNTASYEAVESALIDAIVDGLFVE